MAKSFYVWSLVIYFFEIFCVVFVEGSFSGIQSTLPNLQAVGSTVTVSIQVTQSTGFATIQWKFDTIVVAEIVNNPSVNEFVYQTEATAYKPRLVLGAIKVSNVIVNTNLTFSSLSLPDSGIVITANLDGGSGVSSSDSVILNVTVCPELQCVVSYDNLTSCTYNESGCTSKITCCDGTTTFNATCQADAIWAANGQICRPVHANGTCIEKNDVNKTINCILQTESTSFQTITSMPTFNTSYTTSSFISLNSTSTASVGSTTFPSDTSISTTVQTIFPNSVGEVQSTAFQQTSSKETTAAPTTQTSMMSTGIVTTNSKTTQENTSIDPDPLPGWAIFLIVLAALVVVFAVLFIVWWLVEAFRECLHGVSECFPEDHCCGKDYSKGSSS